MKKKDVIIDALIRELELRSVEAAHQSIQTIYFGGGTPSILALEEIQKILETIEKWYTVNADPEITLEANPDDLTKTTLQALAASPINRLSIGIQSFFEADLRLMNRAHNAAEAKACILEAKAHFDNISIDLIYGIPGMDVTRWEENIEMALGYEIPHISSYALTVEPNTALARYVKKGIVPDIDDTLAQQHFEVLIQRLTQEGYVHYELSNFGKPNYFSQNNTAYWQGKSYLGIGPSAHSFNGLQRSWNVSNNSRYSKALAQGKLPNEIEVLTTRDRYNEYIMTGLRTMWGVSLSRIELEFGATYKKYLLETAAKHIEAHLLYLDGDTLLVSQKGKFLSDGIASDLFLVNLAE